MPNIQHPETEASAVRWPVIEPECECQDVERCPVHYGYDD